MARAPRKPTKPARKPATKPSRKPAATPKPVKSGSAAGARALAENGTAARKTTSAMKKRFDALVVKMAVASKDEARGWDSYFEFAGEILRDKLWIAGGFDSAQQWLESVSDEPSRSLRRNVRVAESSSPDEQVKFTRSKITLALALVDARDAAAAKARGEAWKPSDEPRIVDWKTLRFDVVRDGAKKKLSLDEITAPELQALIDKVNGKPKGSVADAEPTDTERALRSALDASGLEDVTIAQRDHRYTVTGARADQLEALGRALIEAARAAK